MNNSPLLAYLNGQSSGHTNGNGYHTNGNGYHPFDSGLAVVEAAPVAPIYKESYDPAFESLVEEMLVRLGEDPERDGLKRTPLRVAKAMDFLTSGYGTSVDEVINDAVFEDDGEEMVVVKDIEFYSLCEHHMLPFFGKVHIAYVPNGKIIGLSKLARLADVFARRLQVQERLTNQIADTLMEILEPRGVAVVAEAQHFCMMMRGVQKQGSSTVTSAFRGDLKDDREARNEFLRMVRGA